MKIRPRYFPYPVIATNNDSYLNTTFENDVLFEQSGYNIIFTLQASTNNTEINKLLEEGKVSFVHHIECAQTCFRKAIVTGDGSVEELIPQSKLNGIVQINSFIVARVDLTRYKNSDFSQDYKGFSFSIKKGCLLAIGKSIEIEISKQKDDLENTSSIFSVLPLIDPNETFIKVDTSNSKKILIYLPYKSYNIYRNSSSNLELQSVMHSMIIIPALMQAFEELKASRNDLYLYSDCRWFNSLKKACKQLKISLDETELENLDPYKAAQMLLDSPTVRALDYLIGGQEDED
ncbi:MAG: hypothetical protein K6F64_10070 [Clostridia bacterium]|nr:hypothetical protein [Clostridia bacterium]